MRDEEEWPFLIDQFLEDTANKEAGAMAMMEMRQFVRTLINRELELYPEDERHIANYEVEDLGSQFHIRIASTIARLDN